MVSITTAAISFAKPATTWSSFIASLIASNTSLSQLPREDQSGYPRLPAALCWCRTLCWCCVIHGWCCLTWLCSYFILLENGQAIYCWKAQHLISKVMNNIVLYPETIRMMTRSNKVTHNMTIIGKFTMQRIQWSYNHCVSTLQLWTSHILYERLVSPRVNAVWRGTVMWGSLCWATFKQGHHKLIVELPPYAVL